MADHFFGLNKGGVNDSFPAVTVGTSTGATDVEVRIADGASISRKDAVLLLQAIEQWINMNQSGSSTAFSL